MGERLKPAVLKTVSLERGSGVRIPLPPPFFRYLQRVRLQIQSVTGEPQIPPNPWIFRPCYTFLKSTHTEIPHWSSHGALEEVGMEP